MIVGLDPSWYVEHVVVWDPRTDHTFFFVLNDWLSVENGTVEREILASCKFITCQDVRRNISTPDKKQDCQPAGPDELSQFRRVFTSQLIFGMFERHLWLSLWERPAHSRFSRAQRVTCSVLTLHLYLALGALWYAAVGAVEQR